MTPAVILAKLIVRLYLSVWFREHFSFASFMKLFIKLLFRHATAHGLWLPNCPVFTFSMVIPCISKQLKIQAMLILLHRIGQVSSNLP